MTNERRRKVRHAILQSLKKGSSIWDSCKSANIDPSTFWLWRKNNPRLDRLVEVVYESRIQIVEDALFKNCLSGNFPAQAYFLNNRTGKWKSNELIKVTQQTNVVQSDKKQGTDGNTFTGEDKALTESIRRSVFGEVPQK